jgi:hypothetical protein
MAGAWQKYRFVLDSIRTQPFGRPVQESPSATAASGQRAARPTVARGSGPGRDSSRGIFGAGCLVLEVFADSAGLSSTLSHPGLNVDVRMEAYPERGFRPEHNILDEGVFDRPFSRLRAGRRKYVHFGLRCSSWPCIQRINRSSRSADRPEGDETELRCCAGRCRRLVAMLLWRIRTLSWSGGTSLSVSFPWHHRRRD